MRYRQNPTNPMPPTTAIPRCNVSIKSVSILLRFLLKNVAVTGRKAAALYHYRERVLIVAQNATAARIWIAAITPNAP